MYCFPGKYLLFTLMMITVSILISVVNVNIYRRQAFASEMSPWQRWLFVKTLPRILKLKPLVEPESVMDEAMKRKSRTDNLDLFRKISGCIQIIAANFHNRQMENKVRKYSEQNW
ncbi:hypothetical protein ANCDUO_22011 [Ancylostoma duodenale]|uniref:Neurotransmitter-gated ion-channel transmembrane domain-containing protein n=1 Tax=Ancylostoma duodenale TaxID=51022 RepID=A0A0C2FML4_9BILA|nr:hypothetical protein ANCDUO_22011 [Ancylostoma duodenale]